MRVLCGGVLAADTYVGRLAVGCQVVLVQSAGGGRHHYRATETVLICRQNPSRSGPCRIRRHGNPRVTLRDEHNSKLPGLSLSFSPSLLSVPVLCPISSLSLGRVVILSLHSDCIFILFCRAALINESMSLFWVVLVHPPISIGLSFSQWPFLSFYLTLFLSSRWVLRCLHLHFLDSRPLSL